MHVRSASARKVAVLVRLGPHGEEGRCLGPRGEEGRCLGPSKVHGEEGLCLGPRKVGVLIRGPRKVGVLIRGPRKVGVLIRGPRKVGVLIRWLERTRATGMETRFTLPRISGRDPRSWWQTDDAPLPI
jgi:hypothetical protein